MKIISHRGNLCGPHPTMENNPMAIKECLAMGIDVELDAWFVNGELMLGHDEPKYHIKKGFLNNYKIWIHAKNFECLTYFVKNRTKGRCFWHQNDDYTITTDGLIWTFPGKNVDVYSVVVDLGAEIKDYNCYGVCTDYPLKYIEKEKLKKINGGV